VDKVFTKLLYLQKKNYVGLVEGKLYTRGLDYIKTNCLKYAASLQKDLLEKILIKDQRNFQEIFQKYHDDYYALQISPENLELFVLHERVTKRPDNYKVPSTASKVAKWMIENDILFYPGLMVPIIATGFKDKKMEGCHPDSNLWQGKIDRDYIWAHQILPKISRIVEPIDKDFDSLQFDHYVVQARLRKYKSFQKRLLDTKLSHELIEKIKEDPTLSRIQKDELVKFANQSIGGSLW